MFMRDMYESHYGIYNHLSQTIRRPLASVAMHPGEDINSNSLLQSAIEMFIDLDIGNQAKISLIEYLELPSDIAYMILEKCRAKSKKTDSAIETIQKQFEK